MTSDHVIPVSVIVMTKNEAINIDRCLDSVHDFDQVFVVDSHSTDGTAEKARAKGAQVISFTWNGRYPKKKQWCLDHLPFRHTWVLFLDADEIVTPELNYELRQRVVMPESLANPIYGYFIRGRPVFLGRPLRFGQWNKKLILLHREYARFSECDDLFVSAMWEVEGHYQPDVKGRIGYLKQPVLHADSKSFYAWVERHNRYSDWEVHVRKSKKWKDLYRTEPIARRLLKAFLNRTASFRPGIAFIYSYIIRLGFLDGKAGLHYALSRFFYYWLIAVKEREAQPLEQAPR